MGANKVEPKCRSGTNTLKSRDAITTSHSTVRHGKQVYTTRFLVVVFIRSGSRLPLSLRRRRGSALDTLTVYLRANTERQITTHTHGQLQFASLPHNLVSELWVEDGKHTGKSSLN